jgi:pimeloyl-ACP methyl ester carboxylesterase
MIRRAFADLSTRQVHYRQAGEGPPLLMLHASPGSSKQLESKIAALSATRGVIAPDTPGNGDSPPLSMASPEIADYAAALIPFLDAMGIDRCDVYGSHTGASIAAELAILAPERVGKVVFDGIGFFSDAEREHYLAHYAMPIGPDLIGSQFLKAFMFCRDQYIFWPWFETKAANRREGGLPSAEVLHDWVLEVCKALTTYHLSYRAAFRHRSQDRLPLLTQAVLFLVASNDPLLAHTRDAVALTARGRLAVLGHSAAPDHAAAVASAIDAFLGEPGVERKIDHEGAKNAKGIV